MQLCAEDIEAIELATCDAVAPTRTARLGQWLLSFDHGTVGRAKTAVPLTHDAADTLVLAAALNEVEQHYRDERLPPAFRLADVSPLQPIAQRLQDSGYTAHQPTLVMVAATQTILQRLTHASMPATLQFSTQPGADWAAVYTSAGFDAEDGAHRVRLLSRARNALYVSVRSPSTSSTAATGMLAFSNAWASVHGMRTLASLRRQGLCSAVLHGMASQAQQRGIAKFFLQVEETNPAQRLYQRAGFEVVWRYHYWKPLAAAL
jgi:N-acetylglutamate synthase